MTSGTTSFLYKIWGASATDVFAVDMDTREMDKAALLTAMLEQQKYI